jgi:hypothetical protein
MRLPLEVVFRRGVIFLWSKYARLDDPALAGQTKPKYIVILSGSPQDDPVVYILTTSQKDKHAVHPVPGDLFHIPPGVYECFTVDTLIDAGTAGELEIGRDEFVALYESDALIYKGVLSDTDLAQLMARVRRSPRVSRKVKQLLTGE